jgi:hypothetical protein
MNTFDLKPFFGAKYETTSRTTSIQEEEDDGDITMIDRTVGMKEGQIYVSKQISIHSK